MHAGFSTMYRCQARERKGDERRVKLCMFTPKDLQLDAAGRDHRGRHRSAARCANAPGVFHRRRPRRVDAQVSAADVRTPPAGATSACRRDFYAFEQHVKTARSLGDRRFAPEWGTRSPSLLLQPAAIYGPEDEIPYPPDTNELDYELRSRRSSAPRPDRRTSRS